MRIFDTQFNAMTTLNIKEDLELGKTNFDTLEELLDYLTEYQEKHFELSDAHKSIIDQRLQELKDNPESVKPWDQVKSELRSSRGR